MKRAVVIGAGIGGLSAAALLASRGFETTLYEKNNAPGGKMQEYVWNGYRFDTGPSLLTMPFQLEKLFSDCNESIDEYLKIKKPDPLCRYFYEDEIIFDNYQDRRKSVQEIRKFAPEDAAAYDKFLNRAEKLYKRTANAFIFNPLYSLKDLSRLNLFNLLFIDAFSSVSKKVDRYFKSSYLRRFFKRFTTYNGSSPYLAPATLNVIPHVELNQGGYYVEGGLYQIAGALEKLCRKKGVTICYQTPVKSVITDRKKVTGIVLEKGETVQCDLLFSNSDATDTLLNLLPKEAVPEKVRVRQKNTEPSCSGFVMMLCSDRTWPMLKHHNIFFSPDYELEFRQIFEEKKLPDQPTIYLANTSFSDQDHAPAGSSNLFVLVNAPYLDSNQNWTSIKQYYSSSLIRQLEKRGLKGLSDSIEHIEIITPLDFLSKYHSNRGSIYGTSSNDRFSAFVRPRNKLRSLKNLYLVGGSTHPGGGIPLVIQSAFNAMSLLDRT
ncbi:MAG: phytoene desaturase [Balneolaceae bacterium]|nr:MAG: phytoene desaturase [Balneolaceae bacterium]